MDPATIAFSGALLVSLTTNMVQLAMRLMGRTGDGSSVQGKIYEHEVKCRNLDSLRGEIGTSEKRIRDDLISYRQSVGEVNKYFADALSRIEGKLDKHIDKG